MNRKTRWILGGGLLVLAAVVFSVAYFNDFFQPTEPASGLPVDSSPPSEPPLQKEVLTLYFGADEGMKLMTEEREVEIKEKSELPLRVVQELIKGPQTPALSPTIHSETQVLGVSVEEGTATVDFTETVLAKNTGGSARETLFIFSVVNSLCELPEIERVHFSMNGEVLKLFGHYDFSEPYEKQLDIIKETK